MGAIWRGLREFKVKIVMIINVFILKLRLTKETLIAAHTQLVPVDIALLKQGHFLSGKCKLENKQNWTKFNEQFKTTTQTKRHPNVNI